MEIAAPTRSDAEVTNVRETWSLGTISVDVPVGIATPTPVIHRTIGENWEIPPALPLTFQSPMLEPERSTLCLDDGPWHDDRSGHDPIGHERQIGHERAGQETTKFAPFMLSSHCAVAELDGGFDDNFEDFEEDDFDDDFDDDFEEEVEGEYELQDDEYGNEFGEFGEGPIGDFDDDDEEQSDKSGEEESE